MFVFYLPGLAYINRAVGLTGGAPIAGAAVTWMLLVAAVGYRKSNFCCPRCGELFFHKFDDRAWRRDWQHNPFARRCCTAACRSGPLRRRLSVRQWARNDDEITSFKL